MRCPNCQTINPPQAKFCLECGNRLVVCPNCGTVNLPFAKFCIECGTALTAGVTNTSPLPQGAINPSPTNGNTLTALQSANAEEERRVVTIMFADITGSTPLADRLDPEDMRAILTGYFNLMTEQIRRHGGTVEKYIGDAVMAVFGAPIAHEDDPDRAIRAALDMQAALANFNSQRQARDPEATRLQMRIGINTGEVVAQGAQSHRQDFLITGDAVNVAARLQQVATPDTILVGERTYLTTRNVFDFRRIAPLHLRGKPEPIVAWVVQGYRRWGPEKSDPFITQHPRGIEGLEARLVGRELELTLMHATYARVQTEQHPHLITLLGVPGIGKSRLVREFIAGEQEKVKCASSQNKPVAPRVLQGRCPPYGEGITYWPLIEILRSLLNMQDGETFDTIKNRLIELVRDTLLEAKRTEDPAEIASAIARSIGRELDSTRNIETYLDGRERERQHSTHSKSTELGPNPSLLGTDSRHHGTNPSRQLGFASTASQPGGTRGERRSSSTAAPSGAMQGESSQQAELLRAWRIFLEALAQQQPLILVIDDLQWADEALLDLLEYLTDRVTDVPILFLCPARPDFFERRRDWGGGRRNFTTIALESLSTEESSELINELLKTDELPDVLRYTILNRAEGNPFFVEEIVRMLIDQGVLVNEEGCWHVSVQHEAVLSELASPAAPPEDTLLDQHYVFPLRVPDTIQGVLAARIDLLSQVEKRILQDASIIGRTFWLSGLLKLATDVEADHTIPLIASTKGSHSHELMRDSVLQTLDSLVQRDFIVETEKQVRSPVEDDRVFSFKHILIRDVVYNNIPRTRRSQAHAQLALWLEEQTAGRTEQFVELLAYHYQQALATWSATLAGVIFTTSNEKAGVANQASTFAAGTSDTANSATASEHTLEIPSQAGSLGDFLQLSRAELRSRAIRYLTMAGDQALHSYYTIRAIQAYSEALDLLTDSNAGAVALSQMHEKLGDAYAQRANLDEAWQEYRRALQLIQEAPEGERGEPGRKVRCYFVYMNAWQSYHHAGDLAGSTLNRTCRRYGRISMLV